MKEFKCVLGCCLCRIHVKRGTEEVRGSPLSLQQILDPLRLVHQPGGRGPLRGQDQRRSHAQTSAGGAALYAHTPLHRPSDDVELQ